MQNLQINNYIDLFNWFDTNQDPSKGDSFALLSNLFDLIPASIYWKNTKGIYLGRNLYAAKKMVEQSFEYNIDKNYCIGKKDSDAFDKATVELYHDHDNELLRKNNDESLQFRENLILPSGEIAIQVSTKKIFQNCKGELLILGCTQDITNIIPIEQKRKSIKFDLIQEFQSFMILPNIDRFPIIMKYFSYLAVNIKENNEIKKLLLLTAREFQCLCLLVRGSSAKQIGLILNISPRTVEIYLDKMKKRLNIPCRFRVCDWFWEILRELKEGVT